MNEEWSRLNQLAGPRAGVERPVASRGFHLVAVGLGAWMVAGVFVDGWAHINLPSTKETFFTPWHAILYTGFAAVSAWVAVPLLRHRDRPLTGRMPVGYGLGVIGLAVFAAGGLGDGIWHTVFGIETGVDALLSPTHLMLLAGGLLLLTSPVRAAERTVTEPAPSLQRLLPAVVGMTLATAIIAFFFAYAWGLIDPTPVQPSPPAALDEHAPGHREAEQLVAFGILSRMLSTAILLGPLLYLCRRWRPPAGTATILFTAVSIPLFVLAAGSPTADELGGGAARLTLILPPLVAAAAGDAALRRGEIRADRPWMLHGFAAGVALVLWVGHFIALAASGGLAWPPELWGGAIGMSMLTAVGIAALVQRDRGVGSKSP